MRLLTKKLLFLVFYAIFAANLSLQVSQAKNSGNKVPIINVHMEEPDRDPLEVKRIEEERRIERQRLRDMEVSEELDKRLFQQIIATQNRQLSQLSEIANNASQILSKVMEERSTARFLQKDSTAGFSGSLSSQFEPLDV